jgi:protein gp37
LGKKTAISWTGHTFNPWWGCTKVSPGCDNCYAETFSHRPIHILTPGSEPGPLDVWGKDKPRRTFDDRHWNEPLRWEREAIKEGKNALVFCASMADVMDDEAPEGARERLWQLIDRTPHLTWQLLTKRPHRFNVYLPREFKHGNVWLMTTAENQKFYDLRWPLLQDAADRRGLIAGISYEPALGPLSLSATLALPDWVIYGGESGPGRRAFLQEVDWAAKLAAECEALGVKFFMKQLGGLTPALGKSKIPPALQIHEFPEVKK